MRDPSCRLWVEVTGLADTAAVAAIGRAFELHELSLEDALDPSQRGKVEHCDHYTLVVLKTLALAEHVEASQLSIFLGDGFVVTFQDRDDPALEPVRERLRHARGRIRSRGADYLAYALIDSVIDHYFPVVERFDDQLEEVEDAVLEERGADPIDLARGARQDLQTIRHAVWPARDVVTSLLDEDGSQVTDETRRHLRDCYDHVVQLQEMIECSREIAASLLESYISKVSLRTNETMRVLTVIATIFIPLTFITGLYGMNFNPRSSPLNMPELDWYWGYPFSLLVMLAAVAGSLLYFRAKGWFVGRSS
jgi:magnesium transporter